MNFFLVKYLVIQSGTAWGETPGLVGRWTGDPVKCLRVVENYTAALAVYCLKSRILQNASEIDTFGRGHRLER